MKKNIIPDSTKVLSTFENKYAVPAGSRYGMPFKTQQPGMPPMMQPGMPPMMQPGMPPMMQPGMPPMMQPGMPPTMQQPVGPMPPRTTDPNFIQGYLQQFIGEYVRIDFLVGTGTFIDRDGILTKVGVDYVELREVQTGNILVGDMFAIKFVTVYTSAPGEPAF